MTRTSFLFICLTGLFWLIGIAGAAGGLLHRSTISAWSVWSEKDRVRSGAVRVEYFQDPNLVGMVRSLATRGDLPAPEVYVIDEPQCNALALGHTLSQSALALTAGALREFTDAELASVIGHELSVCRQPKLRSICRTA